MHTKYQKHGELRLPLREHRRPRPNVYALRPRFPNPHGWGAITVQSQRHTTIGKVGFVSHWVAFELLATLLTNHTLRHIPHQYFHEGVCLMDLF